MIVYLTLLLMALLAIRFPDDSGYDDAKWKWLVRTGTYRFLRFALLMMALTACSDHVEIPLAPRVYEALAGEVGVVSTAYQPGDVRRYGIIADGVTNWQDSPGQEMAKAIANAAALGVELYWPAGFYRTSINLSTSNVTMRFATGAEFAGVLHILSSAIPKLGETPVRNVRFRGTVATYDRLGTINVRGFTADTVIVKSDPAKNIAGTKGRGVHLYWGSRDFTIGALIVEKVAAQTGNVNVQAAVAIDGFGDNPRNIRVGLTWVQDSRAHGVYVTGPDHDFGEIRVDGYADGALSSNLEDATPEESREGKAVWFNRSSGHVGVINVSQPATGETVRAQDAYAVVLDQSVIVWEPAGVAFTDPSKGVTVDAVNITKPRAKALGVGIYGRSSFAAVGPVTVTSSTQPAAALIVNGDASAKVGTVTVRP